MALDLPHARVARVSGSGRDVVFLPGYPLDHRIWRPPDDPPAPPYRSILLDLPGYGAAASSPTPDTLEGFAEAVARELAEQNLRRCAIAGHSFGGYVALELYRTHPERFTGIILADTRSTADTPEAKARRMATIERLVRTGEKPDLEATVRTLLAPATLERGPEVVELVRAILRAAAPVAMAGTLRATAGRADLTPLLGQIQVPALVVWGEDDQLIPPAESRAMVPWIAGAVSVGIPGAGHLPSLERPARFFDAVASFVRRLP